MGELVNTNIASGGNYCVLDDRRPVPEPSTYAAGIYLAGAGNDVVAAEELFHAKPGQGHPKGQMPGEVSLHQPVEFDDRIPISFHATLPALVHLGVK